MAEFATNRNKKPLRLGCWLGIVSLVLASLLTQAFASVSDTSASVQLKHLRTIKAPYVINRLVWHPDGRQIAAGQNLNKKITIWDIVAGKSIRTIDSEAGGVGVLTYSPDGKYLAVGRIATRHTPDHAHVHYYSANSGVLVHRFVPSVAERGDANDVGALAFSPHGRYLATHGYGSGATGVVYDLSNGNVIATLQPSTSITDIVKSIAWSQDDRWLALGRISGRLELWNVTSWKLEKHGDVSHQIIGALVFSPDSRRLALGSFRRTSEKAKADAKEFSNLPENFRRGRDTSHSISHDIFLLDPVSLAVSSAYASSHNGSAIRELAFTPDGKFLVSGANAKSVALHDVSSGRESAFLKDFKLPAHPALSRDGKYLAVGTGQEIRIYEFINHD